MFRKGLRWRFGGLWRHRDFVKLWFGQTVSLFGSLVGGFALPLAAILVLEATPGQIALLRAAELVPGLVVGLGAGVLVDRMRRRPILIAADVGRAFLLGSIPLAAFADRLGMTQLYVVAGLVSVLSVAFDVAYRAYLPSLVRRDQLVEGNSKLEASASVAEVGGFGLGGVLVQALTAPGAIVVDALSFLVSAGAILGIRESEPAPARAPRAADEPPTLRPGAWHDIREGLRFTFADPALRAATLAAGAMNLGMGIIGVAILVFLVRDVDLSPGVMGPLFAIGGVTSLLGALVARPAVRRWGFGRTTVVAALLAVVGCVFIPLAGGPFWLVLALLAANQLVVDPAYAVFNINQVSLLQAVAPEHALGRVNASVRLVERGASLVGLALGGVLGGAIGLRATLVCAVVIGCLAPVVLARSPVPALRELASAEVSE